ncbi:MAG: alpha/beta hydrolase [Bacteroidota bacterium]
MNIKLRLLLWYVNNLKPKADLRGMPAEKVRAANRKEMQKIGRFVDDPPCEMAVVEDRTFPARDGAQITYRYYQPPVVGSSAAILYFHGGGFVTRDLDSHDKACRRLAQVNQMPVFSVAYRLAPEYKFPVPVEDCYDAFQWLTQNAAEFGLDPKRIVVAGDSAGGNLATVTAILARDAGGIQAWKQVLIYPTADARLQHPSVTSLGKDYFLTKELMHWFVDHYKRTDKDKLNPLMSPLLHDDLSGLPPAYVCTADLDPLRDEGMDYAKKLEQFGVPVIFCNYKSVIHGFLNLRRIMPRQNEQMHQDIREFLAME